MPLGAIISAGSALLGGGLNALSQGAQNRRSMNFSREMFAREQQTNLSNWRLQNEYNSPQAAMKRFQEAGLNPNLIYGQGSGAGNAAPIPSPDTQSPQFRSPEWGNAVSAAGLAGVNAMYDIQIKQAQIDNLKSQNSVLTEEALLKRAQTAATATGEQKTRFGLDFETELRGVSADARREQLRQTRVQTDLSINRDAREAAQNSTSIQEAIERMITLREQRKGFGLQRAQTSAEIARIRENTKLLIQDGTLKNIEIELRNQNINPNDPVWSRYIGMFLSKLIDEENLRKSTSLWDWIWGK